MALTTLTNVQGDRLQYQPQNFFTNPAMDVWQRLSGSFTTFSANTLGGIANGSTVVSANGYTADCWVVLPAGANVAVTKGAGRLLTSNSLQVNGATGVTGLVVKQRIESIDAIKTSNQQLTVQAQVYNGTGGAITPTLTVKYPTAADNYTSTTTLISANSFQSCADAAWTEIAFSFTANSTSSLGMEITFDFGNNFAATSKYIRFTEAGLTITTDANGLVTNPASPILLPVSFEIRRCQRHGLYFGAGGVGRFNNTTSASLAWQFPTPLRTNPQFGVVMNNGTFLEPGVNERAVTPILGSIGAVGPRGGRADVSGIAASTNSAMCIVEGNTDFIFVGCEL